MYLQVTPLIQRFILYSDTLNVLTRKEICILKLKVQNKLFTWILPKMLNHWLIGNVIYHFNKMAFPVFFFCKTKHQLYMYIYGKTSTGTYQLASYYLCVCVCVYVRVCWGGGGT